MSAPTLFVIAADLTRMQVVTNVDESDVGRIRPRQPVAVRVDAFPDRTFTGTVAQVRLQPIVEQNVTTYATVIDVPNPTLTLKPGMTANVTIEIARRDHAVLIPNAALRFRPTDATYAALGLAPPQTAADAVRRTTRVPADDGESQTRAQGQTRPAASGRPPESEEPDTIDALFGPVESPDTPGRVWVYDGTQLRPVAVRAGITNGQVSEVLTGELEAGMELVVNVASSGQQVRAPATLPGFLSGPTRPRATTR
jgi:HlyD family secretion protein